MGSNLRLASLDNSIKDRILDVYKTFGMVELLRGASQEIQSLKREVPKLRKLRREISTLIDFVQKQKIFHTDTPISRTWLFSDLLKYKQNIDGRIDLLRTRICVVEADRKKVTTSRNIRLSAGAAFKRHKAKDATVSELLYELSKVLQGAPEIYTFLKSNPHFVPGELKRSGYNAQSIRKRIERFLLSKKTVRQKTRDDSVKS